MLDNQKDFIFLVLEVTREPHREMLFSQNFLETFPSTIDSSHTNSTIKIIWYLKWGREDLNPRHLHWKYQEELFKLHNPWLQIIQFWFNSKHIDQGQRYDSELKYVKT